MTKGDIILVPFPFTDLSGSKLRPALILMETENDVTAAFMTTQLPWKEDTDLLIPPSSENGLKKESLIRLSKIATLDKDLILGRLGNISSSNLKTININLRKLLKIDE